MMASLCRISLANFLNTNKSLYRKLSGQPDVCSYISSELLKRATISSLNRNFSNKTADVEIEDNSKPVTFSKSEAAQWKAEYSRSGEIGDDSPDAQPYVVALSTAAFLIYFCILREENDIDMKIAGGSLKDPYINLEEIQLKVIVEDNMSRNIETDPKILERLKELEELKLKLAQ